MQMLRLSRASIYLPLTLFVVLFFPSFGFTEPPCISEPDLVQDPSTNCVGAWDRTEGKYEHTFVLKQNDFSHATSWRFVLRHFKDRDGDNPYCATTNALGEPDFVPIPNSGIQEIVCTGLPSGHFDLLWAEFYYRIDNNQDFPNSVVYLAY